MKYTVIYRPSAENRLIELWNDGPNRQAVTRAANEIDARLKNDPNGEGESRTDNSRILIVHPLAVLSK